MAGKSYSPEYYKFRKIAIKRLKAEGLYGKAQRYNMHHLIPISLMPNYFFEEDNVIPLNPDLHAKIHQNYNNIELIEDPVGIILNVLEGGI